MIQSGGAKKKTIKVMTFNMEYGGSIVKATMKQWINFIKETGVEIIGCQETHRANGIKSDKAKLIAKKLGWHYFNQNIPAIELGGDLAEQGIISKFPIVGNTEKKNGVKIKIGNKFIYFFNIHLPDYPYQPYQLRKIPYYGAKYLKTPNQAIKMAASTRLEYLAFAMNELKDALKESYPVFLTGDFNEPSYLDWNESGVQHGLSPIVVEWPVTKNLSKIGMIDTFRSVHKEMINKPGFTWADPNQPLSRERIDFIFGGNIKPENVLSSIVVGYKLADLIIEPWVSDHCAVLTEVEI